jgi:hypothetical protein
MWLDRLIVVDDEIPSSFSLDDEGDNAIIGGRHVERGFIWQCSATLWTITIIKAIFRFISIPLRFNVGVDLRSEFCLFRMGGRTTSSLALVAQRSITAIQITRE